MPVYPNPAGGEMVVANRAEAEARGWTPSMGTFGVRSDPGSGGGGGGGGGGAPAQTVPGMGGDQGAILDAFKAASGINIQDLAERKRQFDATLEWQKQMWANQGLPQLEIQQRAQQEAIREFNLQHELAQSNLGLDYAKTAASLGGPADYFQQSQFLRGAQATGQTPAFLQALQNNTGLAAFNAPGGTAPAVQSMAGLAGQLTGLPGQAAGLPGQAAPAVGNDQALGAIRNIGAAGGQALAPQALEQLTPDEMGLLQSGLRASGFSMPSFLQNYKNSRIAQGAAQAA